MALLLCLSACSARADAPRLRWFYLATNFLVKEQTDQAIRVVERAADAGYNGVVVADTKLGTLDKYHYDRPGNPWQENLQVFLRVCRQHRIEVIPTIFTVTGIVPMLAYNPNLAAGYEVRDADFEVRGGIARLVPDPKAVLVNGGFEEGPGPVPTGWRCTDAPGKAVLLDTGTAHGGGRSVRLEPELAPRPGLCRLWQEVPVRPRRCYRLTAWVRTQSLTPGKAFHLDVGESSPRSGYPLSYDKRRLEATQEWTQVHAVFNSLDSDHVAVRISVVGARSGTVWVDDVQLTEVALLNVLRREGCPLRVTARSDGSDWLEGRDFAPVRDPMLGMATGWPGTYGEAHEPPAIRVLKPVPDGTRLNVGFYHLLIIHGHRVDACLAESQVYALFDRQVGSIMRCFGNPPRVFLQYTEMRTGGGCAACKRLGKTPGELLAANVRTFSGMVRKYRPDVQIFIWDDMFNPHHNARNDYYLVQGTLAGSWEGLDEDMVVVNWYHPYRTKTAPFFESHGLRQMASLCYDGVREPITFTREWIRTMDAHDMVGAFYTTWEGKYDQLEIMQNEMNRHLWTYSSDSTDRSAREVKREK